MWVLQSILRSSSELFVGIYFSQCSLTWGTCMNNKVALKKQQLDLLIIKREGRRSLVQKDSHEDWDQTWEERKRRAQVSKWHFLLSQYASTNRGARNTSQEQWIFIVQTFLAALSTLSYLFKPNFPEITSPPFFFRFFCPFSPSSKHLSNEKKIFHFVTMCPQRSDKARLWNTHTEGKLMQEVNSAQFC